MKKFFLLFILFLAFSFNSFSQENNYKEYSYTEFFTMIENEKDSVFKLSNAIIKPNIITDKAYLQRSIGKVKKNNSSQNIVIDKELQLRNVQFTGFEQYRNQIGLHHITFNKKVRFLNCLTLTISHCLFKEALYSYNTSFWEQEYKRPKRVFFTVSDTKFYADVNIQTANFLDLKNYLFLLRNNAFLGTNKYGFVTIEASKMLSAAIFNCDFSSLGTNRIAFEENEQAGIIKSSFSRGIVELYTTEDEEYILDENNFESETLLDINIYNNLAVIGVDQFNGPISSLLGFDKFRRDKKKYRNRNYDSLVKAYKTEYKIQNKISFNHEIEQLGEFYNYYKNKFNTKEANKYYVDIKDLETRRLEHLYGIAPTFKTFFTWKTNQFLKVFSAYGTEPARAIIYSVYVILIFGFIYLFFPNTWDSHGKNRIIDRYNFFFTYMKRKAGIHEVYLEDQKEELMSYEAFKKTITASENKVPKFFTATALPMYKWAISGTKLSAAILQRIDIVKGTWSELSPNKRLGKSILLIGAFLIAIIYDITIKILNALMLSINTFTTLGFGEIPIKGLPRYLAIIQGFIGWFMLTIFSVSLISQLLN